MADRADGRVTHAELADDGPVPGERYYAAFLEGDPNAVRRSAPTVVALDGSGVEIDRAPTEP